MANKKWKDVIEKVLHESVKTMHYTEIVDVTASGKYRTNGKKLV